MVSIREQQLLATLKSKLEMVQVQSFEDIFAFNFITREETLAPWTTRCTNEVGDYVKIITP